MIELVDPSSGYELAHPSGSVFVMREWTNAMQAQVERACIAKQPDGDFRYDTALEREMKIDFSVVGWRNVFLKGTEVPCDAESKKRLPVGVVIWLVAHIDDRAGLRMGESEKKI